jgi:serine/threonine protein kinase
MPILESNRTLADHLSTRSQLNAEESLHIFKEIVQGLQYVHGQNIIHRDLKPSNIFKGKDNKFKLGDFGQSRFQPRYTVSFKSTPNLGTIFYEAPELKDGEKTSDKVNNFEAYFSNIFVFAID